MWVVVAPIASRDPIVSYFQPFLDQTMSYQVESFRELMSVEFTLEIWAGIFQLFK